MKIEKMEEKKKELREKLGESYSISTKNEEFFLHNERRVKMWAQRRSLILLTLLCIFSYPTYGVDSSSVSQTKATKNIGIYIGEGVGGIIGGATVILLGSVFYLSTRTPKGGLQGMLEDFGNVLIISLTGVPIGSALGVTVAGKLMKQQGSFNRALIGATIGGCSIAGGMMFITILKSPWLGGTTDEVIWNVFSKGLIGYGVGCIIGGVIGYNWK
jgi:hypothetical protein